MKMNSYKQCYLILIGLTLILTVEPYQQSFSRFYSTLSGNEPKQSLIDSVFDIIAKNSGQDISASIKACSNTIKGLLNTNSSIISKMITNSGKDIADIGIEYDCLSENLSYYMITYQMGITPSTSQDEKEIIKLLGSRRDFFTGLCVVKECNAMMRFLLDNNNAFASYLNTTFSYTSVTYLQQGKANLPKDYPLTYIFFRIISIILLIWIIVKLIASCFGNYTLKSEEISFRKIKNIMYEESNNEGSSLINDASNKSKELIQTHEMVEPLFSRPSDKDKDKDKQGVSNGPPNQRSWFKLMDFLSLGSDFVILTSTKNDYYSEKGLKTISFYRMILMFMVIFNHYFYTLYKYPGRDFFNVDFYSSFWFFIVKFSMFSADCFMAVDAFVTSYKLMSYLKKNSNMANFNGQNYFGKLLFLFSLLSVPKIVLFFANFYILHVFAPYYSNLATEGTVHEYYLFKIAKEKECEKDPSIIFIPFKMAYYDFHLPSNMSFGNCYRFVNVYLNQFYIFILFLLLFYLMCRLRSKIFDAVVGVAIILNSLLSYVTFYTSAQDPSNDYNFFTILGQNLTLKHPHLFINTYFLGVFCGFIYFYHRDVLSKNPMAHMNKYTPFSFCHSIMKGIDGLSVKAKYAIVAGCFVVQFILSLSYNIFRAVYKKDNEVTLSFSLEKWMKVFDCYDKQIFTLSFLVILTILMITPSDGFIRHLSNANIFTLFSRINFSIFSSMDSIIYVGYCVFIFQLKMTYPNMIYITIGQYGIVTIVCIIITILFEIPVRIGIKSLLRRHMNKNFIQENYSSIKAD